MLEKGREIREQNLRQNENTDLSIVDKSVAHNTQKIVADSLGWSTGKVAMADKAIKRKRKNQFIPAYVLD